MSADPAGRGPRPPRPRKAARGPGRAAAAAAMAGGPGPGDPAVPGAQHFLYEVPPWVMCRFYKVMDALEPADWCQFGGWRRAGGGGAGRGARGAPAPRPDDPRPAAALIVRDQTELRLCERSGQRTASVLWPWINRNARVADLVRILTHLQLLRARDIITACERAVALAPTPGPGLGVAQGVPRSSSPLPAPRLGLTVLSFLGVLGHPSAPFLPPSSTTPRPNSISAPLEAKAPSPRKLHSSASTLLSPGKTARPGVGLRNLRKGHP